MWSFIIESEWLRLTSHRSLWVASTRTIGSHLVTSCERVKVYVNSLHTEEFSTSLSAFTSRIAWFWLLGGSDRILLHKCSLCFCTIANEWFNVLLLFADLLAVLLRIVRVANHHVGRVEFINRLVARSHISVVLYGTFTIRCCILFLSLLWSTLWSMHLGHI